MVGRGAPGGPPAADAATVRLLPGSRLLPSGSWKLWGQQEPLTQPWPCPSAELRGPRQGGRGDVLRESKETSVPIMEKLPELLRASILPEFRLTT